MLGRLLAEAPADRRAVVAVDGPGASGKSTVTALLAARVTGRPVIVLHADDFLHPPHVRHARGRHSPEGFWLDAYDYAAFTTDALAPLRPGGDGLVRTTAVGGAPDRASRPDRLQAALDALVLVDGTFLHRDELVGLWDWSVYLDVPLDVAGARMALRDGLAGDEARRLLARYSGAQRLYLAASRPWERACVVVDTSDLDSPHVIDPRDAHAAADVV
ncbi:uridine kinase [Cellulomonas sp. H30R-01]|uniref:uridine kinase n=1 Tax=Cellulomonas sp. H30R-01 TaxID=2704467 RepID=UPI00138C880D|nr:uridine kinase [Cellulomonas sp. H30R-01]QHT55981.1 uridine kinase [Cellulomonas sp. H30R-01]